MQTQARICPVCKDDHDGDCTVERMKARLAARDEGQVDPIGLLDRLWRFFTNHDARVTAQYIFEPGDPAYRDECARACATFEGIWAKCDDTNKARFYALMLSSTKPSRLGYNADAILDRMFAAEKENASLRAENERYALALQFVASCPGAHRACECRQIANSALAPAEEGK